jgi:hypothetical protein
LEFAEALREESCQFVPRNARSQAIPEKLARWSSEGQVTGLRLGMDLRLPTGPRSRFRLAFWLHPTDLPDQRVALSRAWKAGTKVKIHGQKYAHPVYAAIRDLARARRLFAPLGKALNGPKPLDLKWDANATWNFLLHGVSVLRDAGFQVDLPSEFSEAGDRRIRARMRIQGPEEGEGFQTLALLAFRWEVTLGDLVLDGQEFAALVAQKKPIVQFRGEWVFIDPNELARLPDGVLLTGQLPAVEALRAVLSGEYKGIPVVSDDRLDMLIGALKDPPEAKIPAGLQGTLRPYQVEGYSWLTTLGQLGLGACLADDMGLGKTIQVITHLLARHKTGSRVSLVVCPTSVLGNWIREIGRFAPSLKVQRYHGLTRRLDRDNMPDVVLTTYGLMVRDQDLLADIHWDVVALDEAQSIKNPVSQRAKAARRLEARHRVALSGTPVENRLLELWSLMEFLVPGLLGSKGGFRRNVAVPVERFGDEDVARRLKLGVSPFLLRRVKSDPKIISDLPEKFERRVYCPLTNEQAELYRQATEEAMQEIKEASRMERRGRILAMLTALKQICNHPDQYLHKRGRLPGRSGKLDRITEVIDTILEAGDSAIIFTQYREMGVLLQHHLLDTFGEKIPFLHGGVLTHHREAMVEDFQQQTGPPLLLISLRAGGTGLNLTRANHVIHYDRWWNPAVEDQATDRAYRIGQHRNVQVHKLICQDTLEERIDSKLDEKRALAESIVGSGERLVTELDDNALRILVTLGDDAVMED